MKQNDNIKPNFLKFLTLIDRVVSPGAGEDNFVAELIEDILDKNAVEQFVDFLKQQHSGEDETFLEANLRKERFYQYFEQHQEEISEYLHFPDGLYQQFANIEDGIHHLKRYFIRMAISENNERIQMIKTTSTTS